MNGTSSISSRNHHPKWVKLFLEINSIFIVLTNSYVLVLIIRKRSHLTNICNIFLLALLCSHLGIGIAGLLMFNIDDISNNPFDHESIFEWMTLCIYQIFSLSTFCLIMLVTIDRVLAIKKPLMYSELTWKFCVVSISLVMVFPVVFIISEMSSKQHIYNLLLFCKAMASIILAVSHHLIYREVKRQYLEIARLIICENKILQQIKRDELHQRKVRSTRACYFMVLSNIVFWLPCGISFVLVLLNQNKKSCNWVEQIRYAAHIFENLNSLKDPLMYAIYNKDLKLQLLHDKRNISLIKQKKDLISED